MSAANLDDPLALLLPDASVQDLELARALTGAFRIFSSDAGDSGSPSVRVQLGSARSELEVYHDGTVGGLLHDLAIHAGSGALAHTTFLALPAPRRAYAQAWRSVFGIMTEGERAELGVDVPEPGESPLSVLSGIVEALERHAKSALRGSEFLVLGARHWRIRLEWLGRSATDGDVAASLELILSELARRRGTRVRALRKAILGDLAALALDRGRVADALEIVRRAGPLAKRAEDCGAPMDVLSIALRWLEGGGVFPRLGDAYERCCACDGLPEVWAELAELCGTEEVRQARSGPWQAAGAAVPSVPTGRHALGATALVVSVLRGNGSFQVIHRDVSPGLVDPFEGWCDRHRLAVVERGTPEHEAIRTARTHLLLGAVESRQDDSEIASFCLGCRGDVAGPAVNGLLPGAIAVEPILDAVGEPIGLLWIELPTRWIPARSVRRAVASAYADSELVAEARGPSGGRHGAAPGSHRTGPDSAAVAERSPLDPEARSAAFGSADDDLQRAWQRAVDTLQLKTAERRWIAFRVDRSTDEPEGAAMAIGSGGGAPRRLQAPNLEGAWAVRRSLRIGGPIRYSIESGEDQAQQVMLHRGAASGAAVPVVFEGQVAGVLSLESTRRGDAREVDVGRWFDTLQESGPALLASEVSWLDRRAFDGGWAFDPSDPDFPLLLEQVRAMARVGCDLLVSGEAGSGRRTVARLVHHLGQISGARGELVTRTAFGLDAGEVERWRGDRQIRTVVIADIDWLSTAAQAALLRLCSAPQGARPRIVGTLVGEARGGEGAEERGDASKAAGGAAGSQGAGDLHPGLLTVLQRARFALPALRLRRHRIPALVGFLRRRVAQREGSSGLAPLSDDAAAVLFRQTWVENGATLEAVLYALHLRGGELPMGLRPEISAQEAVDALVDSGIEVVRRLPSRRPEEGDLLSALWVTRTATMRLNKTRAAAYLGWDPNTLAARLKEAGLSSLEQVAAALRLR